MINSTFDSQIIQLTQVLNSMHTVAKPCNDNFAKFYKNLESNNFNEAFKEYYTPHQFKTLATTIVNKYKPDGYVPAYIKSYIESDFSEIVREAAFNVYDVIYEPFDLLSSKFDILLKKLLGENSKSDLNFGVLNVYGQTTATHHQIEKLQEVFKAFYDSQISEELVRPGKNMPLDKEAASKWLSKCISNIKLNDEGKVDLHFNYSL